MAEAITKHHHAQQVLAFLSQTSEEHVSVEDLAAATKLGAVVYPILSSLHEQGMVEPRWLQKVAGPQLNYQITLKGLESLRRTAAAEKPVRPALKAEPALSKLKAKVARTDSRK
jgi:DNA-binding PadR family transcriptional regulator